MPHPSLDVIGPELDREAVRAVRRHYLIRHHSGLERRISRRQRTTRPDMPLSDLDQTEERIRTREVVGLDTFDCRCTLHPGDGMYPQSSKDLSPSDAMTDVELLAIEQSCGGPATVERLKPFRPAPRERPECSRIDERNYRT